MATIAAPVRPQGLQQATDRDAGAVAQLLTLLGYPCTCAEAGIRIAVLHDEPDQELWLVHQDGETVALLALHFLYYLPLGEYTCRITALAVAGHAQRCGLGKRLLAHAEARARQMGAVRIELTSAAHRHDAHAFYRACSYVDGALRFMKRLGDA